MLSNGSMGTGMMATPDEILAALDVAFGDLDNQAQRIMKWGKRRPPLMIIVNGAVYTER